MPRLPAKNSALILALLVSTGCASEPPLVPLSPAASTVRIETNEPPPGSRLLGPLTASDGAGCLIGGDQGSLENAKRRLRDAAVRQGADFVKLTEVKRPYSGRDCYHVEFRVTGVGYRVGVGGPALLQSAASCTPACAVGYSCAAGVCEARCEPSCGPAQVCRADRVCVPEKAP